MFITSILFALVMATTVSCAHYSFFHEIYFKDSNAVCITMVFLAIRTVHCTLAIVSGNALCILSVGLINLLCYNYYFWKFFFGHLRSTYHSQILCLSLLLSSKLFLEFVQVWVYDQVTVLLELLNLAWLLYSQSLQLFYACTVYVSVLYTNDFYITLQEKLSILFLEVIRFFWNAPQFFPLPTMLEIMPA